MDVSARSDIGSDRPRMGELWSRWNPHGGRLSLMQQTQASFEGLKIAVVNALDMMFTAFLRWSIMHCLRQRGGGLRVIEK